MTSTSTSTRRGVLSDLNVNATICSPSMGSKTGRAGQSSELGETLLQKELKGDQMSDTVREETGMVGQKRRVSYSGGLEQAGEGRAFKKPKGESALCYSDRPAVYVLEAVQSVRSSALSKGDAGSLVSPSRPDEDTLSHTSSAPSSPASSGGFSDAALNDTQVTEPEPEEPAQVVQTLTQAQIRQRAEAVRLRLRLASYKVRTNQTHVPMSRLQIRTIGSDRLPTSRVKTLRQAMPPTTPSNIPNIQVHKASAEKGRQITTMSSSPPPVHPAAASQPPNKSFVSPTKASAETREEFATPLLPRHRQTLLKSAALGSAIWDEQSPGKDLTSSVVKRGTADALLSLKHQR